MPVAANGALAHWRPLSDLLRDQNLPTRFGSVPVRGAQMVAAFEQHQVYGERPEYLIYLPPTMSPVESIPDSPLLESPESALAYYNAQGVEEIIVESKEMGSHTILLVCRSEEASLRRFGVKGIGTLYSRTGRPMFTDERQQMLLEQIRTDLEKNGFWDAYGCDWVLTAGEMLPWNVKAQGLLARQYSHTEQCLRTTRTLALDAILAAKKRSDSVEPLLERMAPLSRNALSFARTLAGYCWNTEGIKGIQIKLFHILAMGGDGWARDYFDSTHLDHLRIAEHMAKGSSVLGVVNHMVVKSKSDHARAIEFWQATVNVGGEGCVFKPLRCTMLDAENRLIQPAVKVRGPEYLRIIYGADYDLPHSLRELKRRALGKKRRHAVQEFALGAEAVRRLCRGGPPP